MKVSFSKKEFRALTATVVIALVFGAYFLRGFISVIIFGTITAFMFSGVYKWLLKKIKNPGAASALTLVIAILSFIIPLVLVLLLTVDQISHAVNSFSQTNTVSLSQLGQRIIDGINNVLHVLPSSPQINFNELTQNINQALVSAGQRFLSSIASSIGGIARFITSAIIYLYVVIALLVYQDDLIALLKKLNPLGDKMSELYLQKTGDMTKAMVKGQFIIAACQGLASAIGLYIAGFHSLFFFWLVFLTVLSIIPLGAGIVTIPIGIVLILTGNVWQGVLVILNHLLVVTNIDNILRPRLVPKTAKLNSALTILGVFAGIAMFGFLGIVVGPVIMILIVSTVQVYSTAKSNR